MRKDSPCNGCIAKSCNHCKISGNQLLSNAKEDTLDNNGLHSKSPENYTTGIRPKYDEKGKLIGYVYRATAE